MKPLILIGGGGHCQSVIEVAESNGRIIQGILDRPEEVGKEVLGYPILGTDDQIPNYVPTCEFVITVGFIKNPSLRIKLFNQVREAGGVLATLIASTAYVSRHAHLGSGTVIMHHAFINAGATIGENVIINTFCNIEHGVNIGNQCHISTGVMVNGDCKIGNNCFIGSQSVVSNSITICNETIIGAGSFIHKNVTKPGIYSENKVLRKLNAN